MPYLIDGSNLIGHSLTLDLSDPKSKRLLAVQLKKFQTVKKNKIVVVFDGPQDPDLIGEKFRKKEFSVLWPDWEESADTVIKRHVEKQTDKRNLIVVTSDREIKTFARVHKAKVLDSKDFLRLLSKILKKFEESESEKKRETDLSPLELEHWLDIFRASDE